MRYFGMMWDSVFLYMTIAVLAISVEGCDSEVDEVPEWLPVPRQLNTLEVNIDESLCFIDTSPRVFHIVRRIPGRNSGRLIAVRDVKKWFLVGDSVVGCAGDNQRFVVNPPHRSPAAMFDDDAEKAAYLEVLATMGLKDEPPYMSVPKTDEEFRSQRQVMEKWLNEHQISRDDVSE